MSEDTAEDQKLEVKHKNKSNIIMIEVTSGLLQDSWKEV